MLSAETLTLLYLFASLINLLKPLIAFFGVAKNVSLSLSETGIKLPISAAERLFEVSTVSAIILRLNLSLFSPASSFKDFSIIVYDNNLDNLKECLKCINSQNYDLSKVEIIIETTSDNLEELKDNSNYIIRANNKPDIATCYNDALKIATGKYLTFINSSILYKNKNLLT